MSLLFLGKDGKLLLLARPNCAHPVSECLELKDFFQQRVDCVEGVLEVSVQNNLDHFYLAECEVDVGDRKSLADHACLVDKVLVNNFYCVLVLSLDSRELFRRARLVAKSLPLEGFDEGHHFRAEEVHPVGNFGLFEG